MPVKIRLMRIGATKRPFYRVVAVDERKKRTGAYLELLGTYNPLSQPKEIILKQDRIDEWLKKGAQPSVGFLRIIGNAPQRQPRKAKKAVEEKPTAEPAKSEESVSETAESAESENTETTEPTETADAPTPADTTETTDVADSSEPADTADQAESEPKE